MNSTLINDFGKKIGGARKDTWKGRGLSLSDLYEMTAEEKKVFVKKDNVWEKPDWTSLEQIKPFPSGKTRSVSLCQRILLPCWAKTVMNAMWHLSRQSVIM